jgi:hypothetical protein
MRCFFVLQEDVSQYKQYCQDIHRNGQLLELSRHKVNHHIGNHTYQDTC